MQIRSMFFILIMILSCSQAYTQIIQFKIPIKIQCGSRVDSLWLGVHGDGPGGIVLDNTYELDYEPAYGSWSERPYPPDFPGIIFNSKFVNIPKHYEIPAALKPSDYRGFTSLTQVDTFAICVCGTDVAKGSVTLSWPNDLQKYGNAWKLLKKVDDKFRVVVKNMISTTSFTDRNKGTAFQLDYLLIKSGVKVDRLPRDQ